MNLNLFDNRKNDNNFIKNFIEELKNALNKNEIESEMENEQVEINEENSDLEEYNIFEEKKIFLDNNTRRANPLAWIMDDNSVCISEDGDSAIYFLSEIDLPSDAKVGQVYEKIDNKYIYNLELTQELNKIGDR